MRMPFIAGKLVMHRSARDEQMKDLTLEPLPEDGLVS